MTNDHIVDAAAYALKPYQEKLMKELLYGRPISPYPGPGRTVTGRFFGKSLLDQHSSSRDPVRRTREMEFAFPATVYSTEHQRLMMAPENITPPQSARQDRLMLEMEISEYEKMAEAVQSGCYINKQGDLCKLRNTKTKKLKNLRYAIRNSKLLSVSMIWNAQLRIIENEIQRRQKWAR